MLCVSMARSKQRREKKEEEIIAKLNASPTLVEICQTKQQLIFAAIRGSGKGGEKK